MRGGKGAGVTKKGSTRTISCDWDIQEGNGGKVVERDAH